jgi:hypothetical protein
MATDHAMVTVADDMMGNVHRRVTIFGKGSRVVKMARLPPLG